MEKKVEYQVVGTWASGQDNTLTTTTSQMEAYDFKANAIERYPGQSFKVVRVTYETIASYEPGMEDANDNP